MGRSRKLADTYRTVVDDALITHFEGNKSKLAKHVDMSRTTVTDFFMGRAVGDSSFRRLCFFLRLDWKQVSLVASSPNLSNDQISDVTQPSETLTTQVKKQCYQNILDQHGQIRLLSGENVGVDQLYVDVWLLEKPEHNHFSTSESLLSKFDISQDRLALGKRIQRDLGFDIANRNPNLLILGKPGSGKTTFLKHLAVDWCKGKFQSDKITVLIELRKIKEKIEPGKSTEQDRKWSLVDTIGKELELRTEETLYFLEQGKLIVLMDGLDEVSTNELRQVVQAQVKAVSKKYSKGNRFILTCRTQIISETPSGFTSVEVADFNPDQIRCFVLNWFTAGGQSETEANKQWKTIQLATTNQSDLKEIAATPVLLSLICVVWQDSGEIPTNRTNLYKKAINWLLNRWNDKKEIVGWEIGTETYRKLNTEDKKALLIEIAARKFENPDNFVLFDQDELGKQISQKLGLGGIKEGISVLKSIEAQHGLLIERADELWSFSHLTFQEYFTVQWLTDLPSQQLAERIVNRPWQEVVKQLVESQQPADRLIQLIKPAIDQLIEKDQHIQSFLYWVFQKSKSLPNNYKPAAIRAFYYSLALSLTLDTTLCRSRSLALILDQDKNAPHPGSDLSLAIDINLASSLDYVFDNSLALDSNFIIDLDFSLALDLSLSLIQSYDYDCAHFRSLNRSLVRCITYSLSSDLILHLNELKDRLPISDRPEEIKRWWSSHGTEWIRQFREITIKHRNIGHDWKFTQEQQLQIERYYKINQFLISLTKIRGAVSKECCTKIEEGLLLPWVELQYRQPHLYTR